MRKGSDIQSMMKDVTDQLGPIDVSGQQRRLAVAPHEKRWSWMKRRGTKSSISRIQATIGAAHPLRYQLVQLRLDPI